MCPRAENPSTRAAASPRGFSLVELIAVITLIAITSAVAVTAVGSTSNTRQKASARQLARDLAYARSQALLTGRTVWVSFDAAADAYSILIEPAGSPGRSGAVALVDPATGRAFRHSLAGLGFEGVELVTMSAGGGTELGFDWKGRPKLDDAQFLTAAATITLTGSTVTVAPQTGHSSWQ